MGPIILGVAFVSYYLQVETVFKACFKSMKIVL